MTRRALVLGAGGIAAYSWQIGLICGMADAGVEVRDADLLVGTSAGARVAAQLAGGASLEQLFQSQLAPPNAVAAPAPKVDVAKVRADILRAKELGGTPQEILKRMGALALATPPDTSPARRNFVAFATPIHIVARSKGSHRDGERRNRRTHRVRFRQRHQPPGRHPGQRRCGGHVCAD